MKNKALIIIFFTVFIDLIGFGIVIPLNPYLARHFGANEFDVGVLMAVYSALQFGFAPFWGRLSDRFGRRPIILVSLLGASLSHLGFAFANEFYLLVLARGFAGLFGANISTAMAYIADVTDKGERSKGMGLIGAAFGLGFTLGPFIGAYFMKLGISLGDVPPFGSGFAAVAAAAICFLNFVMAVFYLHESLPKEMRGKARKRASRFLLLGKHLRRPTVGILMFVYLLYSLAMANMEAPLFMLVQDKFSWNAGTASLGFAYMGMILVFTQGFLVRKLLPKKGERWVLAVGLILAAIGFLGIGFAAEIWEMAVVVTITGVGIGLINPATTGSVSLLTDQSEQGETMGVNQSLSALGRIFGPLMGGWLYREVGMASPFIAAGTILVLAIFLLFSVYQKVPGQCRS